MTIRRKSLTRHQSISVFFLILGLLTLWHYVPRMSAADPVFSQIILGVGQTPLAIPTVTVMSLFGLVFLLSGIFNLVQRKQRLSTWVVWATVVLLFPAILIAATAGKQTNALTLIAETLRLGTPIALGALAGIYCERSGVINIAIEGMMLLGAAFGFAALVFLGNIWLAVLVAILISGLGALLHGWLSISLRTDQIVSGTVINILAIGITGYLRRSFLLTVPGGRTTLLPIEIPGLSRIPVIGELLFHNKPIFYMMVLLVGVTHMILFYTRWGLRMRAVGENPRAADTLGINIYRTRYLNVFIGGMIAGLGGAWFSLETVGNFDDGMTSGTGFIALAAMIFGKWTPFGAFGGAMLFGFTQALSTRFQILNVEFWGMPLPVQFLQILPYLTTIIVLAGFIGRANPPAAIGQPYEK